MTRAGVLIVLAAIGCGDKRETRRAAACLDFTAPEGWVTQAQGSTGDVAIVNPKATGHGLRESFTVRFTPGDRSLEDVRAELVKLGSPSTTTEVASRFQKKSAPHGARVTLETLPPPEVTPTQVDGRDGFRISGSSVMSILGASVEMVQVTVYTKFGTDIVAASAGYTKSREAELRPLSDAFLASLSFARCR